MTMLKRLLPTSRLLSPLLPPSKSPTMLMRPNIPRRMSAASRESDRDNYGTGSASDPDSDHSSRISARIGPSSPILPKNGEPGPSNVTLDTPPNESTNCAGSGSAEGSVQGGLAASLAPDDHHSAFYSLHSAPGEAKARFRASVQRLIRLRHLAASAGPGSEPGVDPRKVTKEYDHIIADCHIDVIDYGSTHVKMREFDNKGFLTFLETSSRRKEDWAKVRWINIKGIDWKVIKALSMVYRQFLFLFRVLTAALIGVALFT
ncbi:hypothetical protein FRB95_000683 [Tulasnella sp. JGI-2019a]|nr:hypothetical protein FRB95_000683 [Tulasnella sp. JGI-2019a]